MLRNMLLSSGATEILFSQPLGCSPERVTGSTSTSAFEHYSDELVKERKLWYYSAYWCRLITKFVT